MNSSNINASAGDGIGEDEAIGVNVGIGPTGNLLQSSLINFAFFLSVGYAIKLSKLLKKENADLLRVIVFKCMMSIFLFRHIWRVQFESSLFFVSIFSAMFYSIWFAISMLLSRVLALKFRERGWLRLLMQGHMLAFTYPLLLETPRFGAQGLACCVMWDLGGNMWICSGILFGVAAHAETMALQNKEHLPDELATDEIDLEPTSALDDDRPSNGSLFANVSPLRKAFRAVALQPMFHAAVIGIMLNWCNVPMPWALDTLMEAVGLPIKPCMYFLFGYYSEITFDKQDRQYLFKGLIVRGIMSVTFAYAALALPLRRLFRETIVVALLSPMSSVSVQIVAESGWGKMYLRMTVVALLVSAMASMAMQHAIIETLMATD